MKCFPIFVVSLLIVIVIPEAFAAADYQGLCIQCATLEFQSKKHLLQNAEQGTSMVWMNSWKSLNCDPGKMNIVRCKTACLKILVERKYRDQPGYYFDGLMMDCGDEIIFENPDLPYGNDYTKMMKNASFVARRQIYRITYNFTMQSHVNESKVVKDLVAFRLFLKNASQFSVFTILLYIIVAVVFSTVVSASIVLLCCDCQFCGRKRSKSTGAPTPQEIQLAEYGPPQELEDGIIGENQAEKVPGAENQISEDPTEEIADSDAPKTGEITDQEETEAHHDEIVPVPPREQDPSSAGETEDHEGARLL